MYSTWKYVLTIYHPCTVLVQLPAMHTGDSNEYDEGQVVQHSLLETNADWHMMRALRHVFHENPDTAKLVQVIIVDKDLNEIRVMQSFFPEARILIWTFHVVKWLKIASRKPEHGQISAEEHCAVNALVHNRVYARTSDEYDASCGSVGALCACIGFTSFFEYIERNWNTRTNSWVIFKRARLLHFRTHTNNALEIIFGKLKHGVDGKASMLRCIEVLKSSEKRRENEQRYRRLRVGRLVNANYDEEMAQVLMFTTHYVAAQVEGEYNAAVGNFDDYAIDVSEGSCVVVKNKNKLAFVFAQWWNVCQHRRVRLLNRKRSRCLSRMTNRMLGATLKARLLRRQRTACISRRSTRSV